MQPSDCKTCEGTVIQDRLNATPMKGLRFGRLVVEELVCIAPRYWRCECACGNVVFAEGGNLRRGNVKSCGKCGRADGLPRYSEWKKQREASHAGAI